MKSIVFLLIICLSFSSIYASDINGSIIPSATMYAIADAIIEIEENTIFALEANTVKTK